jgi:hypothetical protein
VCARLSDSFTGIGHDIVDSLNTGFVITILHAQKVTLVNLRERTGDQRDSIVLNTAAGLISLCTQLFQA